jgi:hypothetical protein
MQDVSEPQAQDGEELDLKIGHDVIETFANREIISRPAMRVTLNPKP